MMRPREYNYHGVKYKKWVDRSVNYKEYSVYCDHRVYLFDTLEELHYFIDSWLVEE